MTTASEIFERFGSFFQQNSPINAALRSIFWMVLTFLNSLAAQCGALLDMAYEVLAFSPESESSLGGLFNTLTTTHGGFSAFLMALCLMSFVILGLMLIFGVQIRGSTVVRNIMFGIIVVFSLPTLMSTVNTAFIGSDISMETGTAEIFKANVVDLEYFFRTDEAGGAGANIEKGYNTFSSSDDGWIARLNINEVIVGKDFDGDIDDVFAKKLDNGTVVESTSVGDMGVFGYMELLANDYYYRYHFDAFPIFISLLATLLVILFSFFKAVRLSYELIINRLFVTIFAVTDIATGARLKEGVKSILSTYVVLAYVPVAVKIFVSFQAWLYGESNFEMNGFVKAMILLPVALAVIDGPNLIERVFGIDAGIKSGFHTAMGLVAAGRTIGHIGSKLGSKVSSGVNSRRRTPNSREIAAGYRNEAVNQHVRNNPRNGQGGEAGSTSTQGTGDTNTGGTNTGGGNNASRTRAANTSPRGSSGSSNGSNSTSNTQAPEQNSARRNLDNNNAPQSPTSPTQNRQDGSRGGNTARAANTPTENENKEGTNNLSSTSGVATGTLESLKQQKGANTTPKNGAVTRNNPTPSTRAAASREATSSDVENQSHEQGGNTSASQSHTDNARNALKRENLSPAGAGSRNTKAVEPVASYAPTSDSTPSAVHVGTPPAVASRGATTYPPLRREALNISPDAPAPQVSAQQAAPTVSAPQVSAQQAAPTVSAPQVSAQQAAPAVSAPQVSYNNPSSRSTSTEQPTFAEAELARERQAALDGDTPSSRRGKNKGKGKGRKS